MEAGGISQKYLWEHLGLVRLSVGSARIGQVYLQETIGLVTFSVRVSRISQISCGSWWDWSNILLRRMELGKLSVGRPGFVKCVCRSGSDWKIFPVEIGGIGQISCRST